MTIEISIQHDPTVDFRQLGVSQENPFNLHFVAKDEDCRKLWAIPSIDEHGVPKKYNSIMEALSAAVEKLKSTATLSQA